MTAKEIMDLKQQRASATVAIRGLLDQFENTEMSADKKAELDKSLARYQAKAGAK